MDESLRKAAEEGNVEELYRLIEGDGNLLKRIDDVEFADTPLHIAARKGCSDFAMEMMNLKSSFARKLNQQGLSPIHLAVENGHKELVLRLLDVDKDLARVKGKKGETPLHYLITKEETCDDLSRFLEASPESIRDVTIENQTALHIAVRINRFDVLQVLTGKLRKSKYCEQVVNQKDKDGKTALHIAAGNNQHKMLKLLLRCKADKHGTDKDGSKALKVAEEFNHVESIKILRGCFIPGVSKYKYVLEKKFVKYAGKASTIVFQDMDSISSEDCNALLVILALLLTATFQANLNPPGGFDNGRKTLSDLDLLTFYILNTAVFVASFFLTLALLEPFPRGFRTALQVLLAMFAICFLRSIDGIASEVAYIFSGVLFTLMTFMCTNRGVSKLSIAILGWWLYPRGIFGIQEADLGLVCLLFIFFYNDMVEGTILVLGYCSLNFILDLTDLDFSDVVSNLGLWSSLCLFRFCLEFCNAHCPVFNF